MTDGSPSAPMSLRRLLVRHTAFTIVALAVVSVLVLAGVWLTARNEAERTAERVSADLAEAVVHQLDDEDFGSGGGYARDELLYDLAPFLESGAVYRVKIWLMEGDLARIVLSDEPRIEGQLVQMPPSLVERTAAGEIVTFRVPNNEEHRFEATDASDLLEAFVGFDDAAGNRMLIEVYVPAEIAQATRHGVAVQLPLVLGGLLLIALATVPLTVALARRLDRDAHERAALMQFGLAASDRERRELAQRLHDGPVQELAAAGIALGLAGPADRVMVDRVMVDRAAALVSGSIVALRELAVELFPPGLSGVDIESALGDLVARTVPPAIHSSVVVEPGLDLGEPTAMMLHRCAGELLRNAAAHAEPSAIRVRVAGSGPDLVVLTVADDGVGAPGSAPPEDGPRGLGLRLIAHAAREAGGRFDLQSGAGSGTRAVLTLPRAIGADRIRADRPEPA